MLFVVGVSYHLMNFINRDLLFEHVGDLSIWIHLILNYTHGINFLFMTYDLMITRIEKIKRT